MSMSLAIALLASAVAEVPTPAAAPAADPARPAAEGPRGPIRMKAAQIKAYNEGLPKDHPAYIRCESEPVTGSLATRRKVCRTNKDWAQVQAAGNDAARGLVQDMSRGWNSGDRPPAGDIRPGLGGG